MTLIILKLILLVSFVSLSVRQSNFCFLGVRFQVRQSTSIIGCVRLSVGRSVDRSVVRVTHLFDDPHVAPHWPTWPGFLSFSPFVNLRAILRIQFKRQRDIYVHFCHLCHLLQQPSSNFFGILLINNLFFWLVYRSIGPFVCHICRFFVVCKKAGFRASMHSIVKKKKKTRLGTPMSRLVDDAKRFHVAKKCISAPHSSASCPQAWASPSLSSPSLCG